MNCRSTGEVSQARRSLGRRAFSLVELTAVLVIVVLLAGATITRFGTGTIENAGADGFARNIALDLVQSRRRTIATGDNHYLQFTIVSGKVTGYSLYRRASGGDVVVEQPRSTPAGVSVTTSHATAEFDFEGASLAAYAISVAGPQRAWQVSTVIATGAVRTVATTP